MQQPFMQGIVKEEIVFAQLNKSLFHCINNRENNGHYILVPVPIQLDCMPMP